MKPPNIKKVRYHSRIGNIIANVTGLVHLSRSGLELSVNRKYELALAKCEVVCNN